MVVFPKRKGKLFVPKSYHNRKHNNFLKNLKFVAEIDKIDQDDFTEVEEFSRKLYEYNKNPSNLKKFTLNSNLDWPMTPKDDLINIELGLEELENGLTPEFFPEKKEIEEKIAEFNAVSTKQFINESYFLYDKSFLIKKTFVTAINKTKSVYGSFSHFQGKYAEKEMQLLDASNFLKFFYREEHL